MIHKYHLCCIKSSILFVLSPPQLQGGPCDGDWTTATGRHVSFHLTCVLVAWGTLSWPSSSGRHLVVLSGVDWMWFSVSRWIWLGEWLLFACFSLEFHLNTAWHFVGLSGCRRILGAVNGDTKLFFWSCLLPWSYLESAIWSVEDGLFSLERADHIFRKCLLFPSWVRCNWQTKSIYI